MELYNVATISGSKSHLSKDGHVTLCGRDVSNATGPKNPCKACADKAAKLADYAARTAYAANVADSQDMDLSQAAPVETAAAPAERFDMANLTDAQMAVLETNQGRVPEVIDAAYEIYGSRATGAAEHRATYYVPDTMILRADVDPAAYSSAVCNANDTARENGYARLSPLWFECLDSSYACMREENESARERAAFYAQQDAETAALALIPAYMQNAPSDTLTVDGVAYAVTVNASMTHQHPNEIMLTAHSAEHPAGFSFRAPRDAEDPFNARFYNVANRDGGIDHPRTLADTIRLIVSQLPSWRTPAAPVETVPDMDETDDATHVIQFTGDLSTMCGQLVKGRYTTLRVSVDPTDANCPECLSAERQLAARDAYDGPTDDETHAAIVESLTAAQSAPVELTAQQTAAYDAHRIAPDNRRADGRVTVPGLPGVVVDLGPTVTVERTDAGKLRATIEGMSKEFRDDRSARLHVSMWVHTRGYRPAAGGTRFQWIESGAILAAPARLA